MKGFPGMSPSEGASTPESWPLKLDSGAPGSLVGWYDRNRRDLPWRKTRDPYRIWVSEIMLQQTTVSTVLRYFDRFIKRFSTLENLSNASLSEVLKLWEGLGYYQRARNLHRAAGMIPVGPGGPDWPRTVSEWMVLPGIGRSTAGAILSISTDTWAPILDANVRRVMERFYSIPPDVRAREKLLWEGSNLWGRDNGRPGDTNQALMELGAVICLPSGPDCSRCPVFLQCRTRGPGVGAKEEGFRGKKGKGETQEKPIRERVALIPESGPLLLEPRNEGRLLEGLMDFPGFSSSAPTPGTVIVSGSFRGARVVETLFTVRQTYSHFQEVVYVTLIAPSGRKRRKVEVSLSFSENERETGQWVSIEESASLALTGVARKIIDRLRSGKIPGRD